MDDVPGVERVEALALLEVPQHGGAVLAPGGAQRPVRRHGHGVQVPVPSNQTESNRKAEPGGAGGRYEDPAREKSSQAWSNKQASK